MQRIFLYIATMVAAVVPAIGRTTVSSNDATINISNGRVSATFATEKPFDIVSLQVDGRETVQTGSNKTPWTLTYCGERGQTPEIDPSCALYRGCEVTQADTTATLTFKWDTRLLYDGGTYPVEMSVSLDDNSPLLKWDLKASVPQDWTITDFHFPTLTFTTEAGNKVITPGGWGNMYELRPSGVYEANYPSWTGSMQMMMIDNGEGALFYSPRDYSASGKLFQIKSDEAESTFDTKVVASEGWTDKTNGTFSVPWSTYTGRHPQGWSAAATDWYRPFALTTRWGSKELSERNIPDWVKDKDLWMRAKYLGDTTVVAVNKAIDYFGEDIAFHWYFWHHHAYDSHYPDYFPANEKFAPIISQVRARNCQVMPYINGRLWDPEADSYASRDGHLASCRRPDGKLYTEIYPTSLVPNTVTCPSSEIWSDVLCELADRIQDELGTNGIYIDQIAAAAPYPCYAENHNHPKGGGEFWYDSYSALIDRMRTEHLREGNIIFSEENAECYIPVFDLLLTVNTPHNPECKIVPLYPLIYSDRVITTAFTYTPYTDVRNGDFRYENMQSLLYGAQLGWVDPRLLWVDEQSEYEARFLKNLADFRKDQHDVFVGGRYVREFVPEGDNPFVDVPVFGADYMIKGSEWISTTGQRVLYVVNSDSTPHTVTLPTGQTVTLEPIMAYRYNID